MAELTDRQLCMRLAKALWPGPERPGPGLYVTTGQPYTAPDEWTAWVVVVPEVATGRGRTKSAAIANLLTKLERLAEKREERLSEALWAVMQARDAREA